MNKPCSFWLTIWPVAQTAMHWPTANQRRLKFYKKLLVPKHLMIQIFNRKGLFFSSSLPTDSRDQPMCAVHLSPSLSLSSIQTCPSFYSALKNKAKMDVFMSSSLPWQDSKGPRNKVAWKGEEFQPFTRHRKWSWSSWQFLNTTELMGEWAQAGSSGVTNGRVRWQNGEEENVSTSNQNCAHLTVPVHLGSLEMKITPKRTWLLRKAADNAKYEKGQGNGLPLCKIACCWIDWVVIQERWF